MYQELNNQLNRLSDLFEAGRDHQKSDEARRVWRAARESVESLRSASEGLRRIGACLESLDSLVRCWAIVGFQSTFRVAGAMLEQARIDGPTPTPDTCIPAL
jgi:hypothetical protein